MVQSFPPGRALTLSLFGPDYGPDQPLVQCSIRKRVVVKPDASERASPIGRLARWEQQEAKAKFSELIRRARGEGPQLVTTRGGKPVVIIAADEYVALTENRP